MTVEVLITGACIFMADECRTKPVTDRHKPRLGCRNAWDAVWFGIIAPNVKSSTLIVIRMGANLVKV